jgi:hypothetical protein
MNRIECGRLIDTGNASVGNAVMALHPDVVDVAGSGREYEVPEHRVVSL